MSLRKKLKRRVKGMKRQFRKWSKFGGRGHLKLFRVHKKAVAKLKKLIARQQTGHISDKGAAFITEFEGVYRKPYNDPAGFATVGVGHLIGYRRVRPSDFSATWLPGQKVPGRLSGNEPVRLLQLDLRKDYEPAVRKLFEQGSLRGKFTQGRYDALVSFAYNLGTGSVQGAPGFETMGRALAAGNLDAIADAFLLYDKAGGQALAGLTRRRKRERRLFLHGAYHERQI